MTITTLPLTRAVTGFARASALAALLGLGLPAAVATVTPAVAATSPDNPDTSNLPQKIADHFSAVKTMTGQFVQFGPRGQQTSGTFYIERPGKLRFNYDKPSPIRVISDGDSIVINNRKLDTWDLYPLSKTPLKLLLGNTINLSSGQVESVKQGQDLTTVVLGDKSIFGNSKITMMFDAKTYELRQWTITDPQGLDTTVMIYDVKDGVQLDPGLFAIDYARVAQSGSMKTHR